MSGEDRRAAPDPFLMQLAVNHKLILERVAHLRAAGTPDVAAFCLLTRDKHTMAILSRASGQEVKPIEYDPKEHAGLVGAGVRGAIADLLRNIYGSGFEAARQLDRHMFNPLVLPVYIQIPSGRWVVHLWAGIGS